MPRRRFRSGGFAVVLAALLLTAGCGGKEPAALKPMPPEVPADLCAMVPAAATAGLVSNSSSDDTGNPTAACSLRSPDNSSGQVHGLVTWTQLDDDDSADDVFSSQCRAIDKTEFKERAGFTIEGAQHVCAADGTATGADSATIAAVNERQVVTVRLTSTPAGKPPAFDRAQQMLEGVLSSVSG